MHHAATAHVNKRHHSQISVPTAFSSDNTSNTADTAGHHRHHPLESFMQMFGSAFHRPSRQVRQAEQQQQTRPPALTTTQPRASQRSTGKPSSAGEPSTRGPERAGRTAPFPDDEDRRDGAARVPTAGLAPRPRLRPVAIPSADPASRPSRTPAPAPSSSAASAWRTALCPRTRKPYYWNVNTRESRWKKPLELASEEEKEAIQGKERSQKEFFEGMERNILRRLEGGRRKAEQAEEEVQGSPGDAGAVSPGNAGGIDQSWMQTTSDTTGADKKTDDWITGWITPGSDDSSPSCGSFSSMEGLSVLDPVANLSPGSLCTSFGSLGSFSREERDDRVPPMQKPKMSKLERIKSASSRPVIDKPNLIRTISKMEYDLVHQLNPSLGHRAAPADATRTPGPSRKGRTGGPVDEAPRTPTTQTCNILSSLHLTLDAEGLNVSLLGGTRGTAIPITPTSPLTPGDDDDDEPPARSSSPADVTRPSLAKRNTCGTIYLGSTLSAPDKDALIKCVCGVYRAHLLQPAPPGVGGAGDAAETFRDRRAPGDYRPLDTTSVPSLSQITDFYRSIFLRSQMEVDCIIISLIYVERLIKMTKGSIAPRPSNWRSVLFSCMVMASKVWDDLSMWNCDFSKIGPSGVVFSLARTNELELALLGALEYLVKVNASEYAKYYFLLRGMLCRSGLASDDMTRLRPLDAGGARRLEAKAPGGRKAAEAPMKGRSKSYGDVGTAAGGKTAGDAGAASAPQGSPMSKGVTLEQIVRM